MLDEDTRLLPTEEDLPDSDEKPVDHELQLLAPMLLRGTLLLLWADRMDWFFGVNLGIYPNPYEPAIGPDGFLSLGVDRVRPNHKLRLSYLVYQEKVMPQWVLEVVSKKPGGEYTEKRRRYAEMGVLYYTIYNPSHHRRDRHEPFEVYRLEQGDYVRQPGNPVWMPELGLGIGHERGTHEQVTRDWLYWYDQQGQRYPAPEDVLRQERILRERESLMRRELEEQVEQAETQLEQAETQLELERQQAQQQERQTIARNLLRKQLDLETIAEVTGLTMAELRDLSL
ncbi:MAG: Uma2 family endonuclease [Synechococcales bacterium]|nr:Uma2 family endonuclease [Synechococcales bacterium]